VHFLSKILKFFSLSLILTLYTLYCFWASPPAEKAAGRAITWVRYRSRPAHAGLPVCAQAWTVLFGADWVIIPGEFNTPLLSHSVSQKGEPDKHAYP